MSALKLKYSSGSKVITEFEGQPRKSIGGIITDTEIPSNLNALFGKVSLKMLAEGSIDYRMIYLENGGLQAVAGVSATATITVSNNANITGDTIDINGTALVEGIDFGAGGTSADTAQNIKTAIEANGTLNALVTVAIAGNVLTLTSIAVGTVGNAYTLTYTDSGSGVAILLSGATFGGGVDAVSAEDITNLDLYTDIPVLASVDDPNDLVPAPSIGDKWIVPVTGKGEWFVAPPDPFEDKTVNTVVGKVATYNGVGWDFSFAPFASYEFGFVAPVDIILGDTTLEESFVIPIENVFEAPSGISFLSANTVANKITIGDLPQGDKLGMWIKRTVPKFRIQSYDLELDEGGIVLDEVIPWVFGFDTP